MVTSSSRSGSQNMAFLSSPGSTNEVDTANIHVILSAHQSVLGNGFEVAVIFAKHESKKVLLTNWPRNQNSSRKTMNVEDTSSKAMVAIDETCFDWSYMANDEVPTNMALMAFLDSKVQNSKTCSNTCLKCFETLKTQYDNLRIEFNKSDFDLPTYKRSLASIEEQLVFYKKNDVMFCDQIDVLKRDASFRDSEINAFNLQREKLKKEKESSWIKIDNFKNASKSLDKLIGSKIADNSRTYVGFTSYNVVTPPPIGLFAPLTIYLSNSGLEEFQHAKFKRYRPKDSKSVCVDTSNEIKKAHDAPIIEDWVSDSDEDEYKEMMVQKPMLKNVEKGTVQREVRPVWNNAMRTNHQNFSNSRRNFAPTSVLKSGIVSIGTARQSSSRAAAPGASQDALKDQGYFDSICSRNMTGNISHLTDFKEHDRGYVSFGGGAKSGKITGKGTIRAATKDETSRIIKSFITKIENLVEKKVKIIRCDNGKKFKNRVMNEFYEEKARTMLADSKLPTTLWAEAVNTACYVQNRVLVVKPHFKTPYELFKGRSPTLSFMRPFGCHVTILNTIDQLGKFNGKSDEGIFVGYSTTSKAFTVYNIRTRKVEENMHITFLKNKPMITGGGPEWLFDNDALSKSMNYAPVPSGINSNDFTGKGTSFNASQSNIETRPIQDYILMPLWKNNSLFNSSLQASDGHNKDKHGASQASKSDKQERPNAESSTKTVNTTGPANTTTLTYADYPNDPLMPDLENSGYFVDAYDETKEDLPHGKRSIRTKWIYRNKRDQRGIVVRIKARLVGQGHRKKEGIDYDEFFAHVARIEAIRLFLAYASFMDFTVYQMDVKSAFLYGTIEEEVYVSQPLGFMDLEFPNRVYKVEKALYGLHQAPRA
nr:putative ribonuclease H-like domain-containing protein [Tanacetum cinerariifolium]